MKIKLLIMALLFSIIGKAQITKSEAFLTGTKIAFYPNQCGNSIPEATGKLTFCDGIDNLGVVERSYGLNDRGVERMLPNHFNADEVYVTKSGLSIRNTDGSWENVPNIAIPTFNAQGDWTNAATIQNGLVLPDGKVIIQSINASIGPITHVYDRTLKTFAPMGFPNNILPQLFVYDSDRNITWILTFNSSDRYLYVYDGNSVTLVEELTDIQGTLIDQNLATLIYKDDYLYLGSTNGLHKIDISNYMSPPLTVTSYDSTTTPSLPFDSVTDLQFDSNNDLWLAQRQSSSDGGLVKFNISTETYDLYQLVSNNPEINYSFQNIALDENDLIWANASNYSGMMQLTFTGNTPNWTVLPEYDLNALGVPITYNPNNIYFRNNQFYFTTSDSSSGSNSNFEVIINDDDVWSGRNDDETGNLSYRMNRRFSNVLSDENGGVWWFNSSDEIVVYRDNNDNHQSILIDNLGNSAAIDDDGKAIVKGGNLNEIRKIDFPNANIIQTANNTAIDMKRVADQVWIYDHTNTKIDAYKNDALLTTYNLDEAAYQYYYYFAADDDANMWFMRNVGSDLFIKKFNIGTSTTTTFDLNTLGYFGNLKKIASAPNNGVWFVGTLGAVYQEDETFYSFKAADYTEIYNVYDIVVDTNGKAFLLNNDSASITTIENPTDANPILTFTAIENPNSVLPSLDHYRPVTLTIDSEGSVWTHASQNTFKLIDNDFATQYIPNPSALSISDYELASQVKIYPNPTTEFINIESTKTIDKLELYDLLGKRVSQTRQSNQIKINHLPNGVYLLKVFADGKNITKKIVIK